MEHDFAVGVERRGKVPARHSGVVVHVTPRLNGRVHVAISRVELEFLLNDRGKPGFKLPGQAGLGLCNGPKPAAS